MVSKNTKAHILSTALDLFALNGYEKTTMRAIANKVGVQSASIYYFFDSKESLLKAMFKEYASAFGKHRNTPDAIWKAASEKPLPDVLSMVFHSFGEPEERIRMMTLARVILSLQYENASALQLIEKVMIQEGLDYVSDVLRGLYSLGYIKETPFEWTAFILHSFALALFEESLRHLQPFEASRARYEEGIHFVCHALAQIIGT